jgi:hypothetical protein
MNNLILPTFITHDYYMITLLSSKIYIKKLKIHLILGK